MSSRHSEIQQRVRSTPDSGVLAEQVRLLYGSPAILLVNLLTACVAAGVLRGAYPDQVLLAWFSLILIAVAARVALRRRFHQERPAPQQAERWGRFFALGSLATGCLWGLLSSVVFVTDDASYYVFVALALCGMTAGAAMRDSEYLPAFYGFVAPAILPMIAAFLVKGGPVLSGLGLMLAAFAAVLMLTGRANHRRITDNIELSMEQTATNADLREATAALQQEAASRERIVAALQESEERFRAISENAQEAMIIGDANGAVAYWNPAAERVFGYRAQESVGRDVFDLIAPETRRRESKEAYQQFVATGKSDVADATVLFPAMRKDGSEFPIELSFSAMQLGGSKYTLGIARDVSQREREAAKLQFANTVLATTIETSPDGILVVDAEARIIALNQRFGAMWRIPPAMMNTGDDGPVKAAVADCMRDPPAFRTRVTYLYAHPEEAGRDELETRDGRFVDRRTAPLRTASGQYLGRVWFFRDVTDRRRAEAEVRHAARHDVLTGIANRQVFKEAVEQAIARTERGDKGFAILYLDLDHFKDVNDTLGHPVGDQLLRAVAARLLSNARATDVVARFGGDEFAVIAAVIDEPANAAGLADKLVTAIGQPFSIEGNDIRISVSIGIAVYEAGLHDPETLLSHADVALYRAKADGRAGYRFFTDAMDAEVRVRVTLGAELRDAIASGQLFLEYQPQIDIETGRIVGAEALVRWRHPTRGVLSPGEFVPVAEATGLVVALDRWVMRAACRQGKAWLDAGIPPVVIGVNVSGAQFKRARELEEDVVFALTTSGLPADFLELELTETVLMEASREHNDVLVRLRRSGVKLAIDDFGTGYSSLDYLRRFPVDRLKIAQEFVRDITVEAGSAAIVRATIALARELGMVVIAEGVENAEQVALLRTWRCAEAQGYYYARPLGAEDLATLFRHNFLLEPASEPAQTAA